MEMGPTSLIKFISMLDNGNITVSGVKENFIKVSKFSFKDNFKKD